MKIVRFVLTAVLALAPSQIEPQSTPEVIQEWARRYDFDSSLDGATAIAVDDSGNVFVTGGSSPSPPFRVDIVTIKYNSAGVQQWLQRYQTGDQNMPRGGITVDDSGNVYVAGRAAAYFTTIKYSSSGTLNWIRQYGNPFDSNMAYAIKVDMAHNVYVAGTSSGAGTYRDYVTIKYNSAGTQQWASRYNGPVNGVDEAYALDFDVFGNVYVTGTSKGPAGVQEFDIATVKYDSSGVQQWVQRYPENGFYESRGQSIATDNIGNIYVAGRGEVSGYSDQRLLTIKYSSSGVQQWLRLYQYSTGEATAIAVDAWGNVIVTGGGVVSGGGGYLHYVTLKYDSSGIQQWLQMYNNGAYGDYARSLALDTLGNVYVTGWTNYALNYGDYATVKYTSAGVQEWVQLYNGEANGNDAANSIAVDIRGNVYVTGSSDGIGTSTDFLTIKYSQVSGIVPLSNEIPNRFHLYQNYPNPFNPVTKIRFDIPLNTGQQIATLSVYDILGELKATLLNARMRAGSYEITWDAAAFPSGVYFCRLNAGNHTESRKMLLLK